MQGNVKRRQNHWSELKIKLRSNGEKGTLLRSSVKITKLFFKVNLSRHNH